MRLWHRGLAGLAVAAAAAALAPSALASSTPTASVASESTAQAGATTDDLGLNLSFSNSSGDTPQALTINLPPGLLANTSITATNGSECIKDAASSSPNSGCEIGTGTVDATASVSLTVPILGTLTVPVSVIVDVDYYLTAPPAAGDLAGLEVYDSANPSITTSSTLPVGVSLPVVPALGQIGSTGDILIRPSGNSDGVGATIKLTGLPNTTDGLALQVNTIDSVFDGLRNPTTCPSTPQGITVSSTSYDGGAGSAQAPLSVTGCSSLASAYAPKFTATATKDSADAAVALETTVTETATEAPSKSIALSFPTSVFSANLNALKNLCLTVSNSCTSVGSVTASSPLYPTALTGTAYLTGNSSGLELQLDFPSPFPLTLDGSINLTTNTASFTGLPDIPLTNLTVSLNGGANGLFLTGCSPASGSATASLTDQNGDRTDKASSSFTVAGCSSTATSTGSGTGSSSGSGAGSGSSSGSSSSGSATAPTVGSTTVAAIGTPSARGLKSGKPSVTFKVKAGKKAAKLTRVMVKLPSGLSFRFHKKKGKKTVQGVGMKGAKARSARLSGGKLVLVFKKGTRDVTIRLGPKALKESKALRAKAEKKTLKRLTLRVTARNAKGKSKALTAKVTRLNLGG